MSRTSSGSDSNKYRQRSIIPFIVQVTVICLLLLISSSSAFTTIFRTSTSRFYKHSPTVNLYDLYMSNSDNDNVIVNNDNKAEYNFYYVITRNDWISSKQVIKVKSEDSINTILKIIKEQNSETFRNVDAVAINIFESPESKEVLELTDKWNSTVTWGTKDAPFIVKIIQRKYVDSEGMIFISTFRIFYMFFS